MKSPSLRVCACIGASLAACAPQTHALDILFVAGSNDADFQSFTETTFAGTNWTHKSQGTGNDQIGGDLDLFRDFDGNNVSVRDYINSFDLVIISQPNSSSQFQQGADWADITSPLLVTNALIARSTGSRIGLLSGDNIENPFTFISVEETVRTSTSGLSDRIFAGVSGGDLYAKSNTDTISNIATAGDGDVLARFAEGSAGGSLSSDSYAIVYWESGDVTGGGFTVAADRAYIPMKGGFATDFTSDGRIVMANLIGELTGANIPEPSSAALLLGIAAAGISIRRRRK